MTGSALAAGPVGADPDQRGERLTTGSALAARLAETGPALCGGAG